MATNPSIIEFIIKGAGEVEREFSAIGRSAQSLRKRIVGTTSSFTSLNRSANRTSGVFKGIVGQSVNLSSALNRTAAGVRQIGQGIMSMSMSMSIFVSVPMAAALKDMAQQAIDFDDALVGVQKTTNLASTAAEELAQTGQIAGNNMEELSKRIRELAQVTPTSVLDLTEMAQAAGQMGVSSVDAIMELVKVSNMLGIATDITSKDATLSMGKLAAAFQIPLDHIQNLASVVDALENTTKAASAEIVKSMLSSSSSAATLGIAAKDVAAMSAVLIGMGLSGEEAGTSLRRLFDDMTKNKDKISQALGYKSVEEFARAMDQDALRVVLRLTQAISEMDSRTGKAMVSGELLTERAKKALLRLAAGWSTELIPALRIANQEWENGTALVDEYGRAIMTPKSMLKILVNNIQELARTMGEVLLPYVVQLSNVLIPMAQLAAEGFSRLNERTKLTIIGVMALLALLGPLMFLIGNIGFGIGIILTGIASVFGSVLGPFGLLLNMLDALAPAILIIGATVAFVAQATDRAASEILARFGELVSAAYQWGLNLMGTYAAGIIQGAVSYIAQAIQYVANMISNFLASFSPPKKGPLRNIAIWGSNLITTYLQAFKNADFSVLSDITNMIQTFFDSLAQMGKMAEETVPKAVLGVRDKVAKLISIFNQTGVISQSVLGDIADRLGDLGGPITRLLALQLRYNRAVAELDKLRGRKDEIEAVYKSEIRAIERRTDLTAEQKAELIRQARARRDVAQDNQRVEEDAAKKNVDGLKEQVEWQKNYVNELLNGLRLLARTGGNIPKIGGIKGPKLKTPKIKAPKVKGIGDIGSLAKGSDAAIEAIKKIRKELTDTKDKIDEMRLAWDMFKKGIKGEEADSWMLNMNKRAREMYFLGKGIHDRIGSIITRIKTLGAEFSRVITGAKKKTNGLLDAWHEFEKLVGVDLGKSLSGLGESIGNILVSFYDALTGGKMEAPSGIKKLMEVDADPTPLERISKALGQIAGVVAGSGLKLLDKIFTALADALDALEPHIPELVDAFTKMVVAFADFISDEDKVNEALKNLATVLGLAVIALILFRATVLAINLGSFISSLGTVSGSTLLWGTVIAGLVSGGLKFLLTHLDLLRDKLAKAKDNFMKSANSSGQFTKFMSRLATILGVVWKILEFVGAAIMSAFIFLLPPVGTLLGGFFGLLANAFNLVWDFAASILDLADAFLKLLQTGDWEAFSKTVNDIMGTLKDDVIKLFTDWRDSLIQLGKDIWEGVSGWFQTLYDDLIGGSIVVDLVNGIIEWFDKLLDVPERIAGFFSGLTEKFQGLLDIPGKIGSKIGGLLGLGGGAEGGTATGLPLTQEDMTALQQAFTLMVDNMKLAWGGLQLLIQTFIDITWTSLKLQFLDTQVIFTVFGSTVVAVVGGMMVPVINLLRTTVNNVTLAVNALKMAIIAMHKVAMKKITEITKGFEGTIRKINAAIDAVQELITALNAIPRLITTHVRVVRSEGGSTPGLQHGGPVSSGKPYIVGERGPEMFVPGSSGVILPHNVTRAMFTAGGARILNIGKIEVRDDRDIDMIIDRVSKELGLRANTRLRFAGG